MNILFVADVSIANVIGGAERVLYEQSTRLAANGHCVHILTRMLPEHTSDHDDINGVHEWRYRINEKNPVSFFLSSMQNARQLFETLHRQFKFDCINFHQPFSAYAVCRSPAARPLKKIYTCHSLSFEEYKSRNPKPSKVMGKVSYAFNVSVRKWLERYVINVSDQISVLSHYTQDKLKYSYNINPEKIKVIHGGVDLERFFPAKDKAKIRQQLGIPTNRLILLTVRNLVNRMGLENLIRAVDQVCRTIPEIFLVIGGQGPLKVSLMEMVRKMDLENYIRFVGFIREENLPDFYKMSDLFVLPTRELEGFGLVTLEAMASGVPVLGTPLGGTREILGSFAPDFLFDDITPAAIADKLEAICRSILENPAMWADTSRRCREFVKTNYGWDKNIHALETLMDL